MLKKLNPCVIKKYEYVKSKVDYSKIMDGMRFLY